MSPMIPQTTANATQFGDATEKHTTRKSFKTSVRDRPKHSEKLASDRNRGQPKKAGAGNWGLATDFTAATELSRNDPNYDSAEETHIDVQSIRTALPRRFSVIERDFASSIADYNQYKQSLKQSLDEFYVTFDIKEFITQLNEYDITQYHSDISYLLHKYSFDKSVQQRTAIDKLLIALVKQGHVTTQQVATGLIKLNDHIDDVRIDVPNASTLLHESVQFLVACGVVSSSVERDIDETNELLADQKTVQSIKEHYDEIISDYFADPHVEHTVDELHELHTIVFAHQEEEYASAIKYSFVTKLINHAFDRNNTAIENACKLLAAIVPTVVSTEQVMKGFDILLARVEDLYLDVPQVLTLLSLVIARLIVDETLPPSFLLDRDLSSNDLGYKVILAAQRLIEQENGADKLVTVFAEPAANTSTGTGPVNVGMADMNILHANRSSSTPLDVNEQTVAQQRYATQGTINQPLNTTAV